MATDVTTLDMNELLLEILNSDSAFGNDMKNKISSTLDAATKKISAGIGSMKFSKEPISPSSILGSDLSKAERDSFKKDQLKIAKWTHEIAKASNWKHLREGVTLGDIFGVDPKRNAESAHKLSKLQTDIAKSIKSNIPTKTNIIPNVNALGDMEGGKRGREAFVEGKSTPVTIESIDKDVLDNLAKAMSGLDNVAISTRVAEAEKPGMISNFLKGALLGGAGVLATNMNKLMAVLSPMFLIKGAPKWLAKAGPIVALIGGIIWMAVDALQGWINSDIWGTSKVSGALSAAIAGSDKGLKGSIKNMGKWALIGAGIGSIVPVVGTLVGGLLGAAVGAILGWIGGERMSRAFDAVGAWLGEKLEIFKGEAKKFFEANMEERWAMIKTALSAPWKWLAEKADKIITWVDTTLEKNFGDEWTNFKQTFVDFFSWIKDTSKDVQIWIDNILYKRFGENWELFKSSIKIIGEWFKDKIYDPVKKFFSMERIDNWGVALTTFFTQDLPNYVKEFIKETKRKIVAALNKLGLNIGEEAKITKINEKIAEHRAKIKEGDSKFGLGRSREKEIRRLRAEAASVVRDKELQIKDAEKRIKIMQMEGADSRAIASKQNLLLELMDEHKSLSNIKLNDFISRPGQPPQRFSEDDTIIGVKDKIKVENKNLDNQMHKLYKVMDSINGKFDDLLDVNIRIAASGGSDKRESLPLPPIDSSITSGRSLAYDEAYNHKMKVWEILRGVA